MLLFLLGEIKMRKCCCICGKYRNEEEFYHAHYNATSLNYCKDCTRKKCDPDNANTIVEVLKDADVPYLHSVWINNYRRFKKENRNIRNLIGFYLNYLNLNDFKHLHFEDTAFMNLLEAGKILKCK